MLVISLLVLNAGWLALLASGKLCWRQASARPKCQDCPIALSRKRESAVH